MGLELHEVPHSRVNVIVRVRLRKLPAILAGLVALSPLAAQTAPDASKILKGVEQRYNRAVTLQVSFTEAYTFQNRRRPVESGDLMLRKPGKMRWQYTNPAGKLFISDGKNAYYYNPDSNRVERIRMKEVEDFRAPLAFLLGRLDFQRDFREYRVHAAGGKFEITCLPRNDRLPYAEVLMIVNPDSRIERMRVMGHDRSVLEFGFANETVNPTLSDDLFYFKIPKDAEYVESSTREGQ